MKPFRWGGKEAEETEWSREESDFKYHKYDEILEIIHVLIVQGKSTTQ